jgi:hypothetical protein
VWRDEVLLLQLGDFAEVSASEVGHFLAAEVSVSDPLP